MDYKSIWIIIDRWNRILRWAFATGIGSDIGLFIIGANGAVRYLGKVTISTYVMFPCVVLTAAVVALGMIPTAGRLDTLSREFRTRDWGKDSNSLRNKVNQKILQSLKPAGIQVGDLFFIDHSSLISIYEMMIGKTIDLLLSV